MQLGTSHSLRPHSQSPHWRVVTLPCTPQRHRSRRLARPRSSDGGGGSEGGAAPLRAAVSSWMGQFGAAAQNLWSRVQPQAQEQQSPQEQQQEEVPPAASGSVGGGSVQQDGQSQLLTFRSRDSGDSQQDESLVMPSAAAEPVAVPVAATAPSAVPVPPISSGSPAIDSGSSQALLSWDALDSPIASAGSSPNNSGSSVAPVDWEEADLPRPPGFTPRRLAGGASIGLLQGTLPISFTCLPRAD
jgi:hypothetical protein